MVEHSDAGGHSFRGAMRYNCSQPPARPFPTRRHHRARPPMVSTCEMDSSSRLIGDSPVFAHITALGLALALVLSAAADQRSSKKNSRAPAKARAPVSAATTRKPQTATPAEALKVKKDFKAELLYSVPKDVQGSWVNMCVDPKGRLIVSDQYGPLYRITPPPNGRGTSVPSVTSGTPQRFAQRIRPVPAVSSVPWIEKL